MRAPKKKIVLNLEANTEGAGFNQKGGSGQD